MAVIAATNPYINAGLGLAGRHVDNNGILYDHSSGRAVSLMDGSEVSASPSSARVSALDEMSDREFSKYMTDYAHALNLDDDSKKYQRAYADIKAAGLNPRLVLDSLQPGSLHSTSAYSYSESNSKSESTSNSFSSSALAAGLLGFLGLIIKAAIK